ASTENVVESLTLREQEILQLIVQGRSNKVIAQELFITVMTVKWYVKQIFRKLHVGSRVQAIVRARELNLIFAGDTSMRLSAVDHPTVIPTEDFQPENPYKGLRAFQLADSKDFFGREKLTEKLVKRLGETGEYARFLAVVGPSGSGKSSLVKAGLMAALLRGDLPGSERWFVVEMMPGARPLDQLEVALTRVAANQAGNLHDHLRRDKNGLLGAASLILPNESGGRTAGGGGTAGSELALVIDQFEETFTLLEDETERSQFL